MKHAETKALLNSCWDETAVKLSYYFDKKLVLDACLVTFMSLMLLLFQILETNSVILKYYIDLILINLYHQLKFWDLIASSGLNTEFHVLKQIISFIIVV